MTDWMPAFPAICPTCKAPSTICKRAHDRVPVDNISADALAQSEMSPQVMRVMRTMNFVKVSDELLERNSAFVDPDGNVTISAAQYRNLMTDAGWSER
jgi:hypothetical protein